MEFKQNGQLLFTATQNGQLAFLDGHVVLPHSANSALSASLLPLTLDLWHRRFGHIGIRQLKHIISNNSVTGIKIIPMPLQILFVSHALLVNNIGLSTRLPLAVHFHWRLFIVIYMVLFQSLQSKLVTSTSLSLLMMQLDSGASTFSNQRIKLQKHSSLTKQ